MDHGALHEVSSTAFHQATGPWWPPWPPKSAVVSARSASARRPWEVCGVFQHRTVAFGEGRCVYNHVWLCYIVLYIHACRFCISYRCIYIDGSARANGSATALVEPESIRTYRNKNANMWQHMSHVGNCGWNRNHIRQHTSTTKRRSPLAGKHTSCKRSQSLIFQSMLQRRSF